MSRRGRELSSQLRSRICELHTYGLSYSKIHQAHPEIPLGTIKSTCRRENARQDNKTQSRSGRPRTISAEQRDQIFDIKAHINPRISYTELAYDVLGDAKKWRSVQRLCDEMIRRR